MYININLINNYQKENPAAKAILQSPKFVKGLRVTDEPTMKIVNDVLINRVNKEIVSLINYFGAKAFSLTYKNSKILEGEKTPNIKKLDLGLVGSVSKVRNKEINKILSMNSVPVISPSALDKHGKCLNINADHAAGAIDKSLKAEKLILLTNVKGIVNDNGSLLSKISEKSEHNHKTLRKM